MNAPPPGPEIVTERLVLSRLRPADAGAMFAYRSDPVVARFQTWWPTSPDEVARFVADQQTVVFDSPGAWFQFGLRLRDTGELAGDAGVHTPASSPDDAEIGITVAPAWQGRGFATEAVEALLVHLFEAAGKRRVVASVDPRNSASVALLTRVGMRRGTFVSRAFEIRGEWVDDLPFELGLQAWKNRPREPSKS